jgi:hypothetical protein
LNGEHFSEMLYSRLRAATEFLYRLTDPESGQVPNYGANDGALVLPLSDCEYPDMRPVLQSCHFLLAKKTLYPAGPWDEEMIWINGLASFKAAHPQANSTARHDKAPPALVGGAGGYRTIRAGTSWAMVRGVRYRDRPSHADQLHFDLWWSGENVFCDAGTYSYHAPTPFDHGFASTCFHNTVTVDGRDQMLRLSRFLWADWAAGSIDAELGALREGMQVLKCEHNGYRKLGVRHRRTITSRGSDSWVIADELTGKASRRVRLHWLMPDVPWSAPIPGVLELRFRAGTMRIMTACSVEARLDLVRAGERVLGMAGGKAMETAAQPAEPDRGWRSRYYAHKEPALSLVLESTSQLPVRFVTVVSFSQAVLGQ